MCVSFDRRVCLTGLPSGLWITPEIDQWISKTSVCLLPDLKVKVWDDFWGSLWLRCTQPHNYRLSHCNQPSLVWILQYEHVLTPSAYVFGCCLGLTALNKYSENSVVCCLCFVPICRLWLHLEGQHDAETRFIFNKSVMSSHGAMRAFPELIRRRRRQGLLVN